MKIEFEITNYKLSFINEMIADKLLDPYMGAMKEEKAFLYLMQEVSTKLLKKTLAKRSDKKAFKLSLKYYEATALHQFLLRFIDYDEKSERRRVTREILGIINQKLV